jgi:hypothetical protein
MNDRSSKPVWQFVVKTGSDSVLLLVAIPDYAAAERAVLAHGSGVEIISYEQVTAELIAQLGVEPGTIVEWRPEHEGEAVPSGGTIVPAR